MSIRTSVPGRPPRPPLAYPIQCQPPISTSAPGTCQPPRPATALATASCVSARHGLSRRLRPAPLPRGPARPRHATSKVRRALDRIRLQGTPPAAARARPPAARRTAVARAARTHALGAAAHREHERERPAHRALRPRNAAQSGRPRCVFCASSDRAPNPDIT